MKNPTLKEYLTVLIRAPTPEVWVNQVLFVAAKKECYIEESHLTALGDEWGGMMRISGNWDALVKMEHALAILKEDSAVWLECKRNGTLELEGDHMPYLIQVVGINKPNFPNEVNYFLMEQGIRIVDVQIETFKNEYSESKLISLSIHTQVPNQVSISDLRERFMILCDDMNADGILEPEKPSSSR